MEAVKKQGEAMTELEAELGKAKKQTQDYEDAMTVLQKDLDDMEAELNKVKQVAATVDKQGKSCCRRRRVREGVPTDSTLAIQAQQEQETVTRSPTRATWRLPTSSTKFPPFAAPCASFARRIRTSSPKICSPNLTRYHLTPSHPSPPSLPRLLTRPPAFPPPRLHHLPSPSPSNPSSFSGRQGCSPLRQDWLTYLLSSPVGSEDGSPRRGRRGISGWPRRSGRACWAGR